MNVSVDQIYTKPKVEFPFSHLLSSYLDEILSTVAEPTKAFVKKYAADFSITFWVSADTEITANRIHGPGVYRKDRQVEYTIFLPFDVISAAPDGFRCALGFLLDGVAAVFEKAGINAPSLPEKRETIIERIVTDPTMLDRPWPSSPLAAKREEPRAKATPKRSSSPSDAKVSAPPALVRINRDDHHAARVGKTAAGLQFFVTEPFVPKTESAPGREFIAVYLFDAAGVLVEARIDDLGPRATVDLGKAQELRDARTAALGKVTFDDIAVQPFSVGQFGVTFGLIAHPPEAEDDEDWCVTAEPGDYMAFYPPWTGDYDT